MDHGGRIIKTIGDEILFVADDPAAAADVALLLTARGEDPDDPFPSVRAAIAHGEVVSRLGDVFGPVGEHRLAADVAGAARHGAGRPARLRGALGRAWAPTRTTTTGPGSRRAPSDGRRHAVPLPPDAPQLGEGVLAPAVVGAAPGVSAAPESPSPGRPGNDRGNVEARPLSTGDTTTTGRGTKLREDRCRHNRFAGCRV